VTLRPRKLASKTTARHAYSVQQSWDVSAP
jgi:hypothetical protein